MDDDFERRLARLMRAPQEHTPFEPRHRARLWEGVRARRRARAAQRAVGSLLAVAGAGLGLLLLPGTRVDVEPGTAPPRPAVSPLSSPFSPQAHPDRTPAPGLSPSDPPSKASSGPPSRAATTHPPATAGGSSSPSYAPASRTTPPSGGTGGTAGHG
ncbi:cellulase [Streptomyces sp. SID625]|nr:cellulase [Streptomyces sp. SID625]